MKDKQLKVLVMERVDRLEVVLTAYIDEYYPDAELKILYSIDRKPQEEIIEAIKWCDIILVQSIFETKFEDGLVSFRKMIELFHAVPALRRPAYIIHTTGRLIQSLNFEVGAAHHRLICDMLKEGLEIYNIYYQEYDAPESKKQMYFRLPTIKKFATVKMWYNEEHKLIWDEHEYSLPKNTTEVFLYKYKTTYVDPKKKESKYAKMTRTDEDILKELLQEDYQRITDLKEDVEEGRYECDEEEKKELLKDHTRRLALLDRLKITSFR